LDVYKTIIYNTNFEINLKNQIQCKNKNVTGFKVKRKPIGKLELLINNKVENLNLDWIKLLSWYEVDTNLIDIDNIEFKPTKFMPTRSITKRIMVFKKPILIKNKYRVIPNFTRYAIDKSGNLILDLKTNNFVQIQKIVEGQYSKTTLYSPEHCEYREIKIHRLVGLAWVYNDNYFEKNQINNINGKKHDFAYSTLEWVSNKENTLHRFRVLQDIQNIPCKLRDIKTNRVYSFVNLSSASEFIGMSRIMLAKVNPNNTYGLLLDRYEFRLNTDKTPWKFNTDQTLGKYEIRLTRNGTTTIIYSIHDFYNIVPETSKNMSFHKNLKRLNKLYPEIKIEYTKRYLVGKVYAYNVLTKQKITASGIRRMVNLTGDTFDIIKKRLSKPELGTTKNNFIYYYGEKSSEFLNKFKPYQKPLCIKAIDTKTNKKYYFNSLREIERVLKLYRKTVHTKALRNETYKHYELSYVKCNI